MIRVIRQADGMEILLNTTMIERVERRGENTVITLANGEQIPIKSPVGDVIEKMYAYHLGVTEENQALEEQHNPAAPLKGRDKPKDKAKTLEQTPSSQPDPSF
jgi:uncharacterized protein YlzI (FlbEa/FlbD family)